MHRDAPLLRFDRRANPLIRNGSMVETPKKLDFTVISDINVGPVNSLTAVRQQKKDQILCSGQHFLQFVSH